MKIVLSVVLNFPIFLQQLSNERLPVKTMYKIFKLKQKTEEMIAFYQENLQRIIQDCALRDQDGKVRRDTENGILISKDRIDECTQRVEELVNFLVDFPEIYFDLEEFNEIKLSLEALEAISPLIIS